MNRPGLSLTVQYASSQKDLPTRMQFRRWVRAAQQHEMEITLRVVDETEGRQLNQEFRGKDYATNVLTFVYGDEPPLYGDLVICAPVAEAEALRQGRDRMEHYAHLVIHGVLHLQGHDHEEDEAADAMEARETAIMMKLGYADPYQGFLLK